MTDFGHDDYRLVAVSVLVAIVSSLNTSFYTIGFIIVVLFFWGGLYAYFKRNRAMERHQFSEHHFQSLFEHSPFLVLLIDLGGRIINANPKSLHILNYTSSELLSKDIHIFFKKQEQDYIHTQFEKVKEGESQILSSTIIKNDGKEISMNFAFVPIKGENEMPLGVYMIARDMTDIVKYEEKIREVKEDLQNTIRQQQGMTFKFVKKGDTFVHTLCDGQLLYKLGFTPDDVIGKSLNEFLPGQEAVSKTAHYQQAWDGYDTYYEGKVNHIHYIASLKPVIHDGKVVEVIGSCIDITDRKKMEEELRRKEDLYRTVLNTMAEGILIYEQDDNIITLNENVEHILGIKSGLFNESTMKDSGMVFLKEDGSPFPFEKLPGVITKNQGIPVRDAVIGVKIKDKAMQWVSINSKPFVLSEKEKESALVTFNDITVQKEQELKLRESYAMQKALIDNLNIGIAVTDENRRIILLNEKFCTMLGIKEDYESYIGKHGTVFHEHYSGNVSEFNNQTIIEILKGREPVTKEVGTTDGKLYVGQYIPFSISEEQQGNLWVYEEITERKKMEKTIILAKEEAEKANMAKTEFLSKMSHELRTPLNGVLGFAQLLEMDEALNEQQQKFVQHILKGGRHLLHLINEILDLSRIEIGQLRLIFDMTYLEEIVDESIHMVEPSARKKKITIVKQLDKCQGDSVFVDPTRLKQVMLNLLDNAIKYNKEGGEVRIECQKTDDRLTIYIRDTGEGFSSEEYEKIFTFFYRIKGTKEDGTGIGLSLVKQLVQLMDGTIGVTSKVGEGSVFWFSLPIHHTSILGHETGNRLESVHNYRKTILTYKILYVEDNQANLQLMNEVLASQPLYALISASDGKKGIERALKEKVDLIVLDMNLPDMNGYEVFQALKSNEQTKDIPVIALSANAMQADIEAAMSSGFDVYLTKPLNINEFLAVLNEIL